MTDVQITNTNARIATTNIFDNIHYLTFKKLNSINQSTILNKYLSLQLYKKTQLHNTRNG